MIFLSFPRHNNVPYCSSLETAQRQRRSILEVFFTLNTMPMPLTIFYEQIPISITDSNVNRDARILSWFTVRVRVPIFICMRMSASNCDPLMKNGSRHHVQHEKCFQNQSSEFMCTSNLFFFLNGKGAF